MTVLCDVCGAPAAYMWSDLYLWIQNGRAVGEPGPTKKRCVAHHEPSAEYRCRTGEQARRLSGMDKHEGPRSGETEVCDWWAFEAGETA